MPDRANLCTRPAAIAAALAAGGLLATLALGGCGTTHADNPTAAGSDPPLAATGDQAAGDQAAGNPAAGGAAIGKTPTLLRSEQTKKMGVVVTDEKGWILYRYDRDTANPSRSTCNGACTAVWTPVIADQQQVPGLDATKVSTVTRDDGLIQVTLSGWPMYYYKGDKKPGDWTGQNVGKTWFAFAPSGKKNLTCVPANPPPPPVVSYNAPTADAPPTADSGSDDYSY
jgi:predicted lipoprotein with Yx(FWY)xxD motif